MGAGMFLRRISWHLSGLTKPPARSKSGLERGVGVGPAVGWFPLSPGFVFGELLVVGGGLPRRSRRLGIFGFILHSHENCQGFIGTLMFNDGKTKKKTLPTVPIVCLLDSVRAPCVKPGRSGIRASPQDTGSPSSWLAPLAGGVTLLGVGPGSASREPGPGRWGWLWGG